MGGLEPENLEGGPRGASPPRSFLSFLSTQNSPSIFSGSGPPMVCLIPWALHTAISSYKAELRQGYPLRWPSLWAGLRGLLLYWHFLICLIAWFGKEGVWGVEGGGEGVWTWPFPGILMTPLTRKQTRNCHGIHIATQALCEQEG